MDSIMLWIIPHSMYLKKQGNISKVLKWADILGSEATLYYSKILYRLFIIKEMWTVQAEKDWQVWIGWFLPEIHCISSR